MIQNILFLIGALFLTLALWGLYQLIGDYLFLISFVALLIVLFSKIDKPKFGKKDK
ncbi:MAG: DUF4175 domain-containing protein [Desulfobacteraceae bacterium]|nr:DUF4175 domain-containing protein [Desulfobacteraceae bacterium]